MGIIEDTIERERTQAALTAAKRLVSLQAGLAAAKADPKIQPGVEDRQRQVDQAQAIVDEFAADLEVDEIEVEAQKRVEAEAREVEIKARTEALRRADPRIDTPKPDRK